MYFLVYNLKSNKQTFIDFIVIIIKEPNNQIREKKSTNRIGGPWVLLSPTPIMDEIELG
jgi:hypothetical protein